MGIIPTGETDDGSTPLRILRPRTPQNVDLMSNLPPSDHPASFNSSFAGPQTGPYPASYNSQRGASELSLLSPRSDHMKGGFAGGVAGGVAGGMAGGMAGGVAGGMVRTPASHLQSASRWRTRGAQTHITGYDPTRLRSAIPEMSGTNSTADSLSEDGGGRAGGGVGGGGGGGGVGGGGHGGWANGARVGANQMSMSKMKFDNSEDSGISEGLETDRHRSSDMLETSVNDARNPF